jgi:site-specific recombinase XerD
MTGEDYQRIRTVEAVKGERLPRGRALEPGEMRALLRACGKDETPAGRRDAAMIATLYACGLRRAEIVGLDLADLDVDKAEVRVRGKGNRERLVPIANGAGDALADWLAVRGDEAGPLFVPINKGGRLSLRRMTAEAAYNMLRKRAAEASVKDFSPHDLRRTFVSDLLDAGADLAVTQRMAGHANVQTTARYDRRGEEAKRKAASLLHVPYRRPAYLAEAETATA